MIYREMPKEGLPVTQARDLRTSEDIFLDVDVVVVGSGTGGAVIAHELAAAGKTAEESARILNLSARTIHFHIQSSIDKLGVSNKIAAIIAALKAGYLSSTSIR